jgi:hypothetical protein
MSCRSFDSDLSLTLAANPCPLRLFVLGVVDPARNTDLALSTYSLVNVGLTRPKCHTSCDRHPGVWRTSVPLLERGLRASRDCDQRFCDRPTTSKQTAATKHSIGAKIFSVVTESPIFPGNRVKKPDAKTKAPSRRRQHPRASVGRHHPASSPLALRARYEDTGAHHTHRARWARPKLHSLTPTHLMDSAAARGLT